MTHPPHTLRLNEAANRLGLDYQRTFRLIRSGRLPAITRQGIYYLDPAEVERVRLELAAQTAESPALEPVRCGRCWRVLETEADIAGVCGQAGCAEVLCPTCWANHPPAVCAAHIPTRAQRQTAAQQAHAAGHVPLWVADVQARQWELTAAQRFAQKLPAALAALDPDLPSPADWGTAHTTQDATPDLTAALATRHWPADLLTYLPRNTHSHVRLAGWAVTWRYVARLERYLEQGGDTEPLSLRDVLAEMEPVLAAPAPAPVHVLGLMSPTGWSAEAQAWVAAPSPGHAWTHPTLRLCLIAAPTYQLWHHPLAAHWPPAWDSLFNGRLPADEVLNATQLLQAALRLRTSVALPAAAAEWGMAMTWVHQAAQALAADPGLALLTLPDTGPVLTRR